MKESRNRYRTKVKMLIIGGCTAAVAVGGALAFFTDTATNTNTFSVAEPLDIEVVETAWDGATDTDGDGIPDFAEDIVPTQTIAKDPKVTNRAGTEAWAVMQVSVPVRNLTVVNDSGTLEDRTNAELFTYTVNDGWTPIGTAALSADGNYMVHTYAATNPVAVNSSTPTLFDEVTLIDAADNQLSGTLNIKIDGYGIQTEGFANAQAAWTAYQAQATSA